MFTSRMGWGWGRLAPTHIVLAFVGILPFLYVVYVGFFQWNVFSAEEGMVFNGLGNYRALVFDESFLDSLGHTVMFMLWAVASELVLGFFLAHSLTREFRGKAIFRTIHTLPLVVAPIAVGAAWRLMLVPGLGPVPYFLDKWLGVNFNIGRFVDHAFFSTVLMDVWHWTPFVTLTLLAGLSGLPREPLEQAMVDGASRWQIFRHVSIPMLMPTILTTVFIRIMDALRVVDEVYMLTKGGPGEATTYIGIYIWRIVMRKTDYGYGSAMSLLTLYFTIVLCWLLFIAITQRGRQTTS